MLYDVKILIGIALVSCLVGFHFWDKHQGIEKARTEIAASYEKDIARKARAALEKEAELIHIARTIEQGKDDEIVKLSTSLSDARKRLSNRPTRPTDSTPAPTNSGSCTGRELYREDGEFLTGEAHRAEQIRIERDYYYQQYESARSQLNQFILDGRNK